ncbi:MAG TPA: sugar phosphate isomerase/epimerase [Mycobacteriales bacterium]|nr:sugar phosphate isomerase/epimerase [Mycobacteriales bacterium]
MKLSCIETMLDDVPLEEKFAILGRAGFDGIDLRGDLVGDRAAEINDLARRTGIEVATVYGRLPTSLLGDSVAERAETVGTIRTRLTDAAAVGAQWLIVVPVFGEARIFGGDATELTVLTVLLHELEPAAREAGVQILLEPLNQRETHLLRSPRVGATLTRPFDSPFIATMADTYHMDLEGQDAVAEVRTAGDQLRLVHLSDRERTLPGEGGIDFAPLISFLNGQRYDGYFGFECRGPLPEERLRRSVEFVRNLGSS